MAKIVVKGKLEEELETLKDELSQSQFQRKVTNVEVFAFLLQCFRNAPNIPVPKVEPASSLDYPQIDPPSMPMNYTMAEESFPSDGGMEFSEVELIMD